jgi:hypothetical protein
VSTKYLSMQQHPLRIVHWSSLTLAAVLLAALGIIDQHLKTQASPLGIVSFELCAHAAACQDMLAAWSPKAQLMAAMSLGLDYLFMLAYPVAIGSGLLLLAPRLPHTLGKCASWLAVLVCGAGLADAVENYHLFQMLAGSPVLAHQWSATLAASIKFVALLPPLLFWLLAALWRALPLRAALNAHDLGQPRP